MRQVVLDTETTGLEVSQGTELLRLAAWNCSIDDSPDAIFTNI